MRTKILEDVISVAVNSWPLPDWKNEAAVCTWDGSLVQGLTHVVYDLLTSDPANVPKLQVTLVTQFTDEEVAAAYTAVSSRLTVGKIGDGHILAWLQSLPWATIIQTIISIITIIPKTPA